jgi:hypothetical protein
MFAKVFHGQYAKAKLKFHLRKESDQPRYALARNTDSTFTGPDCPINEVKLEG